MIAETRKEIIVQALSIASFDEKFAFYHLTVHDIYKLADSLETALLKNGFEIYKHYEAKSMLKKEMIHEDSGQ